MECLHAYGIHSATLQPEVLMGGPVTTPLDNNNGQDAQSTSVEAVEATEAMTAGEGSASSLTSRTREGRDHCQLICSSVCDGMRCCTNIQMQ